MSADPLQPGFDGVGIFEDVPFDIYLQWAGISRSRLWTLFQKTPAHFRYEMDHPEEVAKTAMKEGQAIHAALLEPTKFAECYVGGGPINSKTGKPFGSETKKFAAWAEEQAAAGLIALPRGDFEYYADLNRAVQAHPIAGRLLSGVKREVSVQWRHPETGLLLCCRPDGVAFAERASVVVADVKSCKSAGPQRFGANAYKYGYLFQLAMYNDGVRATTEREVEQTIILALEKEPPYAIAHYRVDEYQLAMGRDHVTDALRQLVLCQRFNDWPGYPEGVEDLILPGYAGTEWTPFADGLEQVLIQRAKRAGRELPPAPPVEDEYLGM